MRQGGNPAGVVTVSRPLLVCGSYFDRFNFRFFFFFYPTPFPYIAPWKKYKKNCNYYRNIMKCLHGSLCPRLNLVTFQEELPRGNICAIKNKLCCFPVKKDPVVSSTFPFADSGVFFFYKLSNFCIYIYFWGVGGLFRLYWI